MSFPSSRIPVAAPDLTGKEETYLLDALRSTWISSTGPYLDRFERDFAEICHTRFALPVSNGTVALHLALLGLDVRPGDEVLVPSLSYVATANAVRYVGAEPVFVDVDPDTWCIDPTKLEQAVTRRTKGIIPVHLYGHPADMDPINHLASVHGLWVVEDAAEAHGALYKGRPVGGMSDIATFSFYGNKIVTSGEGGALTLNNPSLATRLRTLRGQGMDPLRRYYFPVIGYNFRLTNLAAAILCAQLERFDEIAAGRQAVFDGYTSRLRDVPGISFQPIADWAKPAPWLFSITIDERTYGRSRDETMALLNRANIDSRPFFIPIHTLPPYREEANARGTTLPVTDRLAASGINLPTYASLTEANLDRICDVLKEGRR
jgi:perosamine synthetase